LHGRTSKRMVENGRDYGKKNCLKTNTRRTAVLFFSFAFSYINALFIPRCPSIHPSIMAQEAGELLLNSQQSSRRQRKREISFLSSFRPFISQIIHAIHERRWSGEGFLCHSKRFQRSTSSLSQFLHSLPFLHLFLSLFLSLSSLSHTHELSELHHSHFHYFYVVFL
jgi:hypothetical protein